MADAFLGEIRMFAGNLAPLGWALCNGQIMAIAQNPALYDLLGTQYGGDGVTTYGLPDLRGRVAVSAGQGSGLSNYFQGQSGGTEAVTLTNAQMPLHTHAVQVSPNGATDTPVGNYPATDPGANVAQFSDSSPNAQMNAAAISAVGGGQPHNNLQPVLALSFLIALQGIFPSRG